VQIASNRSRGGHSLLRPGASAHEETRASRTGARIASLAVANGETVLSQDQVLKQLGLAGDEFAERIFQRSGVRTRHLELDDDFLSRTLQGRAGEIERRLTARSVEAVEALGIEPERIGAVFSSSLYSLGLPTLAHRILDHFEMDPSTDKYHIDGIGCASGVPLLRLAAQSLNERPDKQVLVLAAESMSGLLSGARPGDERAKVVGSALFGDGCAAALLSRDPDQDGPIILASQVHQIPGTLDAVSLRIGTEDGYLHLARELPAIAGEVLRDLVDDFLAHNRMRRSQVEHWIVHPGGRRIIENVQTALELSDEDVATSWDALANHGNVGTPSILYVMKDAIERYKPEPSQRALMVTIGPGVTVGLMLLGW
jgi:alkylresorcinol/alkylpyrone synthase